MLRWTKTLMWSKGQQEQHSRNQDRQKVPGQRLVDLKLLDARRRRTLHHSRKTVSVHSANGKEPVCHSRSYIPQEIAVKHLASSTPASPVKHTCVSPNTQCSSYAQTTNPIQINVLPRQIRHRWLCRSRSCSHQEISDKKFTNLIVLENHDEWGQTYCWNEKVCCQPVRQLASASPSSP